MGRKRWLNYLQGYPSFLNVTMIKMQKKFFSLFPGIISQWDMLIKKRIIAYFLNAILPQNMLVMNCQEANYQRKIVLFFMKKQLKSLLLDCVHMKIVCTFTLAPMSPAVTDRYLIGIKQIPHSITCFKVGLWWLIGFF